MINLKIAIEKYREYHVKNKNCRLHQMFEAYADTAQKRNGAPEAFITQCPIMFYPENCSVYAPRKAFWYIWDSSCVEIEGYGLLDKLFDCIDGYAPWFGILLLNTGITALFWYPKESEDMKEWSELTDDILAPSEFIARYNMLKTKSPPKIKVISRFFDIHGGYTQKEYEWIHTEYGLTETKIIPDIMSWVDKL